MDCGRADVLLGLPHSGRCLGRLVQSVGIRPRVRHRRTGFETVRAMVAGGMGWSVLNQRPVHSMTYGGGEVVTLELEEPFEPLPPSWPR
ncbi:LysR substrate-binding domain-containing protein [Streptomyces sp. NPDC003442]